MINLNELDRTQKELIEKAIRRAGTKSSYELPITRSPEETYGESSQCNLYQATKDLTNFLDKTKNSQ